MASGQELNVENAQIRTLLDRQKEQILAECQAETKKHEFQANYDRRSVQKLSETIESQQEELHCAQAEELQRARCTISTCSTGHTDCSRHTQKQQQQQHHTTTTIIQSGEAPF